MGDDQFWADIGDALASTERIKMVRLDVERLMEWLEPSPETSVLDLCAGPGAYALELAARGLRVTAVDTSKVLVERGRDRCKAAGMSVNFEVDDARCYSADSLYDMALCLGTSLGYFGEAADDERLLRTAAANLVPGGTLVVELVARELVARQFREKWWVEVGERVMLLERTLGDDEWRTLITRTIVLDGCQRRSYEHSMRVYSAAEVRNLCICAGFDSVSLYGDFDGRPHDQHANRLVAVARTADGVP